MFFVEILVAIKFKSNFMFNMLKYKINRQVGEDIFTGLKKSRYLSLYLKRVKKRKKNSLYFKLLRQRKIIKIFYNLNEKQYKNIFKIFYKNASYKQNPLLALETRLDIFLMRVNWVASMVEAKQLILHGWVLVNGNIVTTASFILKPGDIIQIAQYHCESVQKYLKNLLNSLKKRKKIKRKNKTDNLSLFKKHVEDLLKKRPHNKFKNFSNFIKHKKNNNLKNKFNRKPKKFVLKKTSSIPKYIHSNFNILSAVLLKIPTVRQIPYLVKLNPIRMKRFYLL